MKKSYLIIFMFVLMCSLVSCNNELEPTPTIQPTQTANVSTRLDMAFADLPATLDPHRSSNQVANTVLGHVCQRLVGLDYTPLLATDWSFDETNTSMTVNLRRDVIFSDGTPFTSEAVTFSFERLAEDESEGSPLYELLQGVQVEELDDFRVLFTFSEPRKDFLDVISTSVAAIISPTSPPLTFPNAPICTGPYIVAEWQEGEFILLVKNENHNSPPPYFANLGPPHIDEIKIHLIETHDERFQALLDGILDVNHINTQEDLEEIRNRPDDFKLSHGSWFGGITYLGFNYGRTPLNELSVRQALAHAVDKQALIRAVLADDFAIPAISFLSPRTIGYTEDLRDVEYGFDLEASRSLLQDSGFADMNGDGILERNGEELTLVLLTTTDDIYLDMATILQSQYEELGIVVDIQQRARSEISDITPTGEFDLLLYDYNWGFPNALSLFLHSENIGSLNRVFYSNPDVDVLLEQIPSEDPTANPELLSLLEEIQRQIIQDVPWQPILARRSVSAINSQVVGEETDPRGFILWHDAMILEP